MTRQIELKSPILMGGGANESRHFLLAHRSVARKFGTCLIIVAVGNEDDTNLRESLGKYISVLDAHEQKEEADAVRRLLHNWQASFVKAAPRKT